MEKKVGPIDPTIEHVLPCLFFRHFYDFLCVIDSIFFKKSI